LSNDNSETIKMIRDQAARLLTTRSSPERLKELLDKPGGFDRSLWDAASESGWPCITIPEARGGLGLGWQGLCAIMEELGERTASIPLIGNSIAAHVLTHADESAQVDNLLDELASGTKIACLALAEPDELAIDSLPKTTFDGNCVSGSKSLSPFAAVADIALTSVRANGRASLAIVPLDHSNVTRNKKNSFDNSRAYASIEFHGAPAFLINADTRRDFIKETIDLGALATSFEQIGGTQAAMAMARDFALSRKAFGQPIGSFQAVKHKIADMYCRLEIARGCALDALDAYESGSASWHSLTAAARLGCINAYEFSAKENIQTHGGLGVTWEAMPHHYYRRSKSLSVELGNIYYWRDRLLTETGFDSVS